LSSDTTTLTVSLSMEAEVPNFVFDAYSGVPLTPSAFPVKSSYAVGESVYIHFCVKNVGNKASTATVTVTDLDTGAVITTYSIPITDPGWRWKTSGSGAFVGPMPNKNWRLQLKVEP